MAVTFRDSETELDVAIDGQAMVGSEHQQPGRQETWLERVLDQPEPDRQRPQFTQAAADAGAALQLVAKRLFEQRVRRRRDERAVWGHGGGSAANSTGAGLTLL